MRHKSKFWIGKLFHTSKGRARFTTHWFSSGYQWIWNYDLISNSAFKNLIQVVKAPPIKSKG